jgi:aminopeptidase YwaD
VKKHLFAATAALLALAVAPASAQEWTVRPEWVRAHESFLASPALQGRGSATRDEAIAAAYVAAQFEGFGLKAAPGMAGYLQPAQVVRTRLNGATLTAGGAAVKPTVLIGSATPRIDGKLTVFAGAAKDVPAAEVLLVTGKGPIQQFSRAASAKKVRLVIVRAGEDSAALLAMIGGTARMPSYLADGGEGGLMGPARATVIALAPREFDALAAKPGADVRLDLDIARDVSTTTNAIGWLPGSDPSAGTILLSAHLDHLGPRPDGTVFLGANDDASGTAAVIELARALAAGKRLKRNILFVAYGSEEIGGFGSTWFGMHPPVPLGQIVANVEIEMIGAQDPKLPAGQMMMTGFERSTLGETLKAHGALVGPDPYPDQHFFERSDNYSLARKGVVAHTISGWAVVPTYHSAQDTIENIDIAFMTRAIQSLVAPLRSLANSDAKPEWKPGGRPTE